jgi:hypothetical protein
MDKAKKRMLRLIFFFRDFLNKLINNIKIGTKYLCNVKVKHEQRKFFLSDLLI